MDITPIAPSRERGLKQAADVRREGIGHRSLTGARIETYCWINAPVQCIIAPSRERGLKHRPMPGRS